MAVVPHDLRNPLNAIAMNVALISIKSGISETLMAKRAAAARSIAIWSCERRARSNDQFASLNSHSAPTLAKEKMRIPASRHEE